MKILYNIKVTIHLGCLNGVAYFFVRGGVFVVCL